MQRLKEFYRDPKIPQGSKILCQKRNIPLWGGEKHFLRAFFMLPLRDAIRTVTIQARLHQLQHVIKNRGVE